MSDLAFARWCHSWEASQHNLPSDARRPTVLGVGSKPIIAESARKHGVSDEDMLQVYANPFRVFGLDEGLTMVIVPTRSRSSSRSAWVDGAETPVIVHAMRAREKFLR